MKPLLQFLVIPVLIFVSHYTSILTYSLAQNLKTGNHITPLLGWQFQNWFVFILVSLAILQPFYYTGGVLLFVAHKLAINHFHIMYPSVVLNMVAMIFWTIIMMYLKVKEIPTRDGWIAIALITIASLLAMNAGKNTGSR